MESLRKAAIIVSVMAGAAVVDALIPYEDEPAESPEIAWVGAGEISRTQEQIWARSDDFCVFITSEEPFEIDALAVNVTWSPVHEKAEVLRIYDRATDASILLRGSPATEIMDVSSIPGGGPRPHIVRVWISSIQTPAGSYSFTQPVQMSLQGIASSPVSVEPAWCATAK